jgi:hypothetical protein
MIITDKNAGIGLSISVLLLISISLLPLFLGNILVKEYGGFVFAAFFLVCFYKTFIKRDLFFYFTPGALVLFYTITSLTLGAFGFSNGTVIPIGNLAFYDGWMNVDKGFSVILISLTILFAFEQMQTSRVRAYIDYIRGNQIISSPNLPIAPLVIFIPFFFVSLDLGVFGADGDLSVIPRSVFAICIIYLACKLRFNSRMAVYLLLLLVYSTFSIDSKREAIFLIFPMIYFEVTSRRITPSFRVVFSTMGILIVLLYIILLMSIARGYGGFDTQGGLFESITFIVEYLNSELFIASFLNNIEVNYFYFHALNSIELVLRDTSVLSYGSTIIKFLFTFIPRSIMESKPDSIITLYTELHSPLFRAEGGSWPISVFSEYFWNFYYFSPLFIVIFSFFITRFGVGILKAVIAGRGFYLVFLMFCYMELITFVRGSGFDQYFVYICLAGFFVFLSYMVKEMMSSSKLQKNVYPTKDSR